MTKAPTVSTRPKPYPPPEFPPRQPKLFARTPPAIFPPILGLLGLAAALRLALGRLGIDPGPGDLLAGVAVALWTFAALALGWGWLAEALFWATLPMALAIWAFSLRQFARAAPPAPLRPLLAIHLAPAALFATVAGLLARQEFGVMFAGLGLVYAILLVAAGRWLLEAGVTAMWGAFTFPLAALAMALLVTGGVWLWPGIGVTGLGLVAIPWILWWILKRWPGGKLATVTNAAEA